MGQNIVKGERMGLSPLAVSELAKEFRRLAADLGEQANNSPAPFWQKRWRGRAEGLEQAAQMLEEKLNG